MITNDQSRSRKSHQTTSARRIGFSNPVVVDWQEQLDLTEAQATTHCQRGGKQYARVICTEMVCDDCMAEAGELHVLGCDSERCPACKHQAVGCVCEQ